MTKIGRSAGAGIWRQQVNAFSKTHRVIAIDPRSQGESTKTTTGNTPKTRVRRHDKKPVATSRAASSIFTELMNAEQRSAEADLSRPDLRYLVVPVPLMSNGAAASACSELPISRRKATGVV
jgi:pimeloyl-ACP methyl ester carboxylesterase